MLYFFSELKKSMSHMKIPSFLFTVFTMLLVGFQAAAGMDESFAPIYVDPSRPSVFRLIGPIDNRTLLNFKRASQRYGTPNELLLSSPGGFVHEGLSLALEIKEKGVDTRVAKQCLSACFFVFMAGKERAIEGNLGVHQMSSPDNDFSTGQTAVADMLDVLNQLGVPKEILIIMLQTPANEMHIFSESEIEKFRLEEKYDITEPINFILEHHRMWNNPEGVNFSNLVDQYDERVDYYGQAQDRISIVEGWKQASQNFSYFNFEFTASREKSRCYQDKSCKVVGEVSYELHAKYNKSIRRGGAIVTFNLKRETMNFVITSESSEVLYDETIPMR